MFRSSIHLICALAVPFCARVQGGTPPSANEYRHFALLHEGDPQRGQALFNNQERLACTRCHTVDGTAAKAGPDLFAVGDKFGRRDIIDAILSPSASIAVGYSTTTILTTDGEEVTGIIKQATSSALTLMGADAASVRVARDRIQESRTSEVSLMPEGLQSTLSPQEFTDLIEYLVSLKQPESASSVHEGMPSAIPVLANPVRLRPLHGPELGFEHPVWFGEIPGQPHRYLVVEHETGRVWRLEELAEKSDSEAGTHEDDEPSHLCRKTLFVDTGVYAKGTRGLIGLAFHPRFAQNRKYYLAKHTVEHGNFATLIWERTANAEGTSDSGAAARLVLKLDAVTNVHYGGSLAFGPDGFLYIGMGDTGPQEDPEGHAQNTHLLLGKILRIDVDKRDPGKQYAVPSDNPFVAKSGFRPEIWAYGLREPWRFSFDPLTNDLWVGDVGQDRYEEVDLVRRGENYGWNVYEGFEPFSNQYRRDGESYIPPVFAYRRKYGPSVTGGFVYRAERGSSFYGVYIFGDYQSQRLFGLTQHDRVLTTVREIGLAPERVVSFGRDEAGALYVVGYEGTIYRMDLSRSKFE